ncbi:hypothetical protein COOONC_28119 [Cooperia oncophora]
MRLITKQIASMSFNDCMYWDENVGVNVILFDRIKRERDIRRILHIPPCKFLRERRFLVLDYAKILKPGNFGDLLLEHMRTGGFRMKLLKNLKADILRESGFKAIFSHRMIITQHESKPGDDLLSSCEFAGDCRAILQDDGSIHCSDMKLSDISLEFPRYCYDLNMRDYRYVYGSCLIHEESEKNGVVKVDLKDGTSKLWCKDAEDHLCHLREADR